MLQNRFQSDFERHLQTRLEKRVLGLADAVVTRLKIGVEGQRDGAVTQRKMTLLVSLGEEKQRRGQQMASQT